MFENKKNIFGFIISHLKKVCMKIFTISLLFVFTSTTIYSQKKLKTKEELKNAKVYRSLQEAMYNKRKVYILNLDGQNLE